MSVILSPRGNEASNMMKRFVRYEEAAQYFGIDETLIVAYAKAAGGVYQLSKIRLIKIEPLEEYMIWGHDPPRTHEKITGKTESFRAFCLL